jgi:hypothetical protein
MNRQIINLKTKEIRVINQEDCLSFEYSVV